MQQTPFLILIVDSCPSQKCNFCQRFNATVFARRQATNKCSESALHQGFINPKSKIYGSKIGSFPDRAKVLSYRRIKSNLCWAALSASAGELLPSNTASSARPKLSERRL